MPSGRLKFTGLAMAKVPISARTLLGFLIENSGCRVSFSTVASAEASGRGGLVGEPVVDDEMVVLPALVEALEGLGPLGRAQLGEHGQRAHLVGGVAGVGEMRRDAGHVLGRAAASQVAERGVAQRPLAGRLRRRRVGSFDLVLAVGIGKRLVEHGADRLAQLLARVVDGERVHVPADDAGEVALARQEHELGAVAGVEALVVERDAERCHERAWACSGRLPARRAFTASTSTRVA